MTDPSLRTAGLALVKDAREGIVLFELDWGDFRTADAVQILPPARTSIRSDSPLPLGEEPIPPRRPESDKALILRCFCAFHT